MDIISVVSVSAGVATVLGTLFGFMKWFKGARARRAKKKITPPTPRFVKINKRSNKLDFLDPNQESGGDKLDFLDPNQES